MTARSIGQSGIALAPLVFGGNVFGWTADRDTSFALLDRLLAAGLTSIDTADMYSAWVPGHQGGESESLIGAWLAARGGRDRIQLITKVGLEAPCNPAPHKGLTAAYIERAVEASLRRLRTDYLDVYMSHTFDASVPQEETLRAYERLIQAGKVRTIGASNFDATQLGAALDLAREAGLPRYELLEPHYNLHDRDDYEGPLRTLAIKEGLAVISYFSLASGFLTGKYRNAADLDKSPRGESVRKYLTPRGFAILSALDRVAGRHDAQPAEVALAWLMHRPGVTAPIASATSLEQLESLIRATRLQLGTDDLALLDAASATAAGSATPVSEACVKSAEPERVLARLCAHWRDTCTVQQAGSKAEIELPFGRCLLAAGSGMLTMRLEGRPEADMAGFEEFIAAHVQRMACDEAPLVSWQHCGR